LNICVRRVLILSFTAPLGDRKMVLLLVPASLTSGTTWEVKVHHVIEAARLGEVAEFWRSDGHCGNRQDFMITSVDG
jgi:hypothetical protein